MLYEIEHVELSISAHCMQFSAIAAPLEHTIARVHHHSVWPGLMSLCLGVSITLPMCLCALVQR